ncbi:hypothetical protein PIB30_060940 [Stylosanthes scabra]|uniref:Uncharacterized protein n=1 Tax=Stylosanthes scabra TaxID=79078 RepID=A0ABU6VJ55_9FABA|nr:hypothetical protein [Stylosanthes scabra]
MSSTSSAAHKGSSSSIYGFVLVTSHLEDITNGWIYMLVLCDPESIVATGNMIGHLANPRLVVPLKSLTNGDSSSAPKAVEIDRIKNLVGAGHQAFENFVLQKLQFKAVILSFTLLLSINISHTLRFSVITSDGSLQQIELNYGQSGFVFPNYTSHWIAIML